jgi:hypothetical protein
MSSINAKLIQINPTQQVTDTFKKRTFWVEYFEDNPQYTETLEFQLIQDKCKIMDSYKVGEQIEVSYNLKGRTWTNKDNQTKVFNTLQAWRVAKVAQNTSSADIAKVESTLQDKADSLPF